MWNMMYVLQNKLSCRKYVGALIKMYIWCMVYVTNVKAEGTHIKMHTWVSKYCDFFSLLEQNQLQTY